MVSVSIVQRGKTSFRLRTKWRDAESGEYREVNETIVGTRDYAETKKSIILSRFKSGHMTSMSNDTVKGFLTNWMEKRVQLGAIRPTSAETYRSMLQNFIEPHGDSQLVSVTPAMLRQWVMQTLATKGAATTRYTGKVLKKAFKQAVKEGLIPFSPFEQVELPANNPEQKERILNGEQVKAVWDGSYQHEHGLAVRIGLESGARRGEIAALRWCDISSAGVIEIRRTAVLLKGQVVISEPKTKKSRRKVRVSTALRDEINTLRLAHAPTDYIFGTDEAPRPDVVSKAVVDVLRATGMEGFTAHDLRHAHATHLLRSKLNPAAVSRRLGHSKTSITLDVYGHALEEDDDEILGAINNVLR